VDFFGESFVEAPAMFQNGNYYFAVFGTCCCYCQSGSPVNVYVSKNPLGPFNQTSNLGLNIPAQQTDISFVLDSNGNKIWLWHGDEWQSSPDGQKAHDFSYLGILTFTSETEIAELEFLDSFVIDVGP